MKKSNVTCVQRAQFVLPFFESGEWRNKEASLYDTFVKNKHITPCDVKALTDYTTARMTRTTELFTLLLALHNDWEITAKKECVILETETMDFEAIIPKLTEAGFSEKDYVLYSEYTRKWGML